MSAKFPRGGGGQDLFSSKSKLYSKFSFGEVYCRIYGQKFSFTATGHGYPYHNELLQDILL